MFDIYGIGNALVDSEVEVTNDELSQCGIEKGVMSLIQEDRLQELKKRFSGTRVRRACGGSAANTIISATLLGASSYFSSKVARDDMGCFYIEDLKSYGVCTSMTYEGSSKGTTGTCFVLITPDADRTMNTFLGITSEFSEENLDVEALKKSKVLYIEGYLVCTEPSLNAALKAKEIAKANNVKVALSLSDPSMIQFFSEGIKKLAEGVDIIFCNKDEALAFTERSDIDQAKQCFKDTIPLTAVTLGAEGVVILFQDSDINIEGFSVDAVDTTGAGDSFAGGFLAALGQGKSLEEAGQLGCFISSRVVSSYGPRLQSVQLEEVLTFKRTI